MILRYYLLKVWQNLEGFIAIEFFPLSFEFSGLQFSWKQRRKKPGINISMHYSSRRWKTLFSLWLYVTLIKAESWVLIRIRISNYWCEIYVWCRWRFAWYGRREGSRAPCTPNTTFHHDLQCICYDDTLQRNQRQKNTRPAERFRRPLLKPHLLRHMDYNIYQSSEYGNNVRLK